jgi:large subunit ribosomal protein L17
MINRKLGRKKSNREHLIRNQAASLVLYEFLDTTEAKAKEVKRFLEKVIARSKKNTLAERRQVLSIFFDKNASMKLINELIPRYEGRASGFIRSYHLKNRLGDNATAMRLELVDKKVFVGKSEALTTSPKAGDRVKTGSTEGKVKEDPTVKTTIKRKNKVVEAPTETDKK